MNYTARRGEYNDVEVLDADGNLIRVYPEHDIDRRDLAAEIVDHRNTADELQAVRALQAAEREQADLKHLVLVGWEGLSLPSDSQRTLIAERIRDEVRRQDEQRRVALYEGRFTAEES